MSSFFLFTLLCTYSLADRVFLGTRTSTNFPSNWQRQSSASPHHLLTFIVALKQQNLDTLETTFWDVSNPDSPNYRNFMTINEITQMVSPPKEDQAEVIKYLAKKGASRIENRGDNLLVTASVAVAAKIFKTEFSQFRREDGKVLVRQFGSFSLSHKISKYVEGVFGLSEFPSSKTVQRISPKPNVAVTISPQSIQLLYQTTNAYVAGNSSACVIEFEEQNFSPSDLAQFASDFNVNISPLTPNHIIGNNDPSSPQIEATLDIQYILGVAQKAISWFWIEGSNVWLYGFATHMFATADVPLISSISYGWNEEDQCENGIGAVECNALGVDSKGYARRVNIEFQKLGIRGLSIFSASGDSGANGRTDPSCSEDHLNPPFPAASPFITSVGATQISDASGQANLPGQGPPGCQGRSCASGGVEQAVSFDQARFASGGGFSWVAPMPDYQKTAVQAYLSSGVKLPSPASMFNALGHGFPHIAALGSQVLIESQGTIEPVGGTSASSPIVAGIFTLLNDYVNTNTGRPLGFVSPLIFKMGASCPKCFTDITVGDNICTENGCSPGCQGFLCTRGWDPVTGWGTPVYTEMLQFIKTMLKIDA